MQRITYIFFVICFLLTGCSTSRFNNVIPYSTIDGNQTNLTNYNFDIQKIEIIDNIKDDKYLAFLKFRTPDKYLVSLRTNLGIEIGKIFLTKDSLYVFDRIHNTFLDLSQEMKSKKYGVSSDILPLLFGDIIINLHSKSPECMSNKSTLSTPDNNISIKYLADCEKQQIVHSDYSYYNNKLFSVSYDDFSNLNNLSIPNHVSIISNYYDFTLKYSNFKFDNLSDLSFSIPTNATIKE